MNKYPDRPISPKDICLEAGIEGSALRSLLPRMVVDGVIRRTSHGRYELENG